MADGKDDSQIRIKNAPASFRSGVWKYFGFRDSTEKEKTVCKICYTDVSYRSGNTSNMATHLNRKHAIRLSKNSESVATRTQSQDDIADASTEKRSMANRPVFNCGQLSLHDFNKQKLAFTSGRSKTITIAIAGYIAMDMRPYSTIENEGFKYLLNTIEPRYQIPSRTYLASTTMPKLYGTVKSRIASNVLNSSAIALTTDGWTSRATHNYITITAHYVDESFDFKCHTLQTRKLSASHTGENLALVLNGAKQEWNLQKTQPIAVTTDNASNIVSGINSISSDFSPHIRCFAHTLNLATQRGIKIPQVDRLAGRIRRVVTFFHKSTTATAVLESKQVLLDIPKHKLIQDVATRWNSTYDMFERYIEQQPAIFATLLSKDVKSNAKDVDTVTDDDFKAVEDLLVVLKPIKTVTTLMCDNKHPTLSLIHPIKEMLLFQMAVNEHDSTIVKAVKKAILEDLKPRYTDPKIYEFLLQSSALDPRFKTLPYITDAKRQEVFAGLAAKALLFDNTVVVKAEPGTEQFADESASSSRVDQATPEVPELPTMPGDFNGGGDGDHSVTVLTDLVKKETDNYEPTAKKKCCIDDLFGDVFITGVEKGPTFSDRVNSEMCSYKAEITIPLSANPLAWWKLQQDKYPILCKMAKYYLGIPATSVPSERVFSAAGEIVTAQRASLSPDNVDLLIFLKSNMKIPNDLKIADKS